MTTVVDANVFNIAIRGTFDDGQAIVKNVFNDLEFKDKNVLLVDDSIVRGTTSKQIIDMARQAGAKNVYFASAAPAVRYPNVYGIDMPTADELAQPHNRISRLAG